MKREEASAWTDRHQRRDSDKRYRGRAAQPPSIPRIVQIIRTFAGVAATLLVVAFAVPATGTPSATLERAGNFKIDKIHYKQGATLNSEYIVIKKTSAKKRALTHFRVVDPNDGQRYTFPATSLKPGHTVTLHTGHGHNGGRGTATGIETRPSGTTTATPPGWSTRWARRPTAASTPAEAPVPPRTVRCLACPGVAHR